jgi:hypothetical protein
MGEEGNGRRGLDLILRGVASGDRTSLLAGWVHVSATAGSQSSAEKGLTGVGSRDCTGVNSPPYSSPQNNLNTPTLH